MIILIETGLLVVAVGLLSAAWVTYRRALALHDAARAECDRARQVQAEMHREWGERQARFDATLLEMQRLNGDFEEAAALFEYGATEEAIETAGRWKERRHAAE